MNYMERAELETKETMERVRKAVSGGMSPTNAINRNAHTAESYSAALKEYGLKPDIPD
jgi:hypothetical protein